jgi:hypothetical protein
MYWNTVTYKEYTGTQEYTFVVDWKTGTNIRDLQGTGQNQGYIRNTGIYIRGLLEHRDIHKGYTVLWDRDILNVREHTWNTGYTPGIY